MPKGSPSAATLAKKRYNDKTGVVTRGYTVNRDIADQFKEACAKAGVSQAQQLKVMMTRFIEEQSSK